MMTERPYTRVEFANLPTTIPGYSIKTPDDWLTIVINARCDSQKNLETYLHEVGHDDNDDFDSMETADVIERKRHSA